jgi:NADH:ubiquinone oxidoreductase subunit 2 (subunit N)
LGKPGGTTVFIDFQDLAGIAIFGVVLSLFYALLGAVPLTVPVMILVLLIASVICGNMK